MGVPGRTPAVHGYALRLCLSYQDALPGWGGGAVEANPSQIVKVSHCDDGSDQGSGLQAAEKQARELYVRDFAVGG